MNAAINLGMITNLKKKILIVSSFYDLFVKRPHKYIIHHPYTLKVRFKKFLTQNVDQGQSICLSKTVMTLVGETFQSILIGIGLLPSQLFC